MARLPRLYAPRIPQLAQARFAHPLAPADAPAPATALDRIRGWLAEEAGRAAAGEAGAVALHGWIVLPDRITLLATPGDEAALSRLMQALGRRMGSGLMRTRVYTGRYRNALLEPGRWVLPAMIWLESLPVSTGQVGAATQWPWSSAAEHAGLGLGSAPGPSDPDGEAVPAGARPALTDHPDYWREGDTPFARQAAWRNRLAAGLGESQGLRIEAALAGQWALGEKIFLAHLGRLASRRVSPAPRGRPRKTAG
ncbi:transposase [Castellaniella sp. WN]